MRVVVGGGGVRIAAEEVEALGAAVSGGAGAGTSASAGAPVVLVVHGFASSRAGNWLRARWGSALSEGGFRVVAVDLRGHGESGKPRSLAAYALPRFREDLVAVLDAFGVERAHVLGYSLGARLSWDLAVAHPERVRALALGGAPVTGSFLGFDAAAARGALAAWRAGAGLADAIAAVQSPETRRYLEMMTGFGGNDPDALVALAEAGRRRGFRPEAAVPRAPLLLVSGSEDQVAAPSAALASRVPGAHYVEIPGRDHITTITSRVFKQSVLEHFHAH